MTTLEQKLRRRLAAAKSLLSRYNNRADEMAHSSSCSFREFQAMQDRAIAQVKVFDALREELHALRDREERGQ
jgi:hypothetical protein